ncbi:Uncharacterised protein [Vibrio cholerae]|uniref:Uncharacterized protein n=1 Tax=Vibrio cholerae TaxID=666 RepID=A0A655SGI7_VIBCL|nr:Uncharacterised protein [Vibrio cholerae]CSB21841.1 Uncharacterised protein [Vibrio cholerae]
MNRNGFIDGLLVILLCLNDTTQNERKKSEQRFQLHNLILVKNKARILMQLITIINNL